MAENLSKEDYAKQLENFKLPMIVSIFKIFSLKTELTTKIISIILAVKLKLIDK